MYASLYNNGRDCDVLFFFLGAQQKSEVFVEMVRALPDPFGTMFSTLIDVCAYAGTGNVLKIQKLLHICSEHYETKETKEAKKKVIFDRIIIFAMLYF